MSKRLPILRAGVPHKQAMAAARRHIPDKGNFDRTSYMDGLRAVFYVGYITGHRAALLAEVDRLKAYADKLAAGLPEGMLPKDVEVLREANAAFATENQALKALCGRVLEVMADCEVCKDHEQPLLAELREAAK